MHLRASVKAFSLLGAAALSVPVAAQSTFSLFAYGTNGGLSAVPLIYDNGYVMLSNLTSPTNTSSVYFTSNSSSPSTWTVHPDTSAGPVPPFAGGYVVLEASGTSSRVGVGNSSSDALALLLFGQTVFAKADDDDKLKNPFYAAATETEGVYQLVWDPQNAADDKLEAVILRTEKPPGQRD
ncbi:hypothetical protein V2A60_005932 [Cordyceps javanica]